jgi:hypothetical protein
MINAALTTYRSDEITNHLATDRYLSHGCAWIRAERARNHRSLSSLAGLLVCEWLPTTPRSPAALADTRQRQIGACRRFRRWASRVTAPRAAQMFLLESRFDSAGCGVTGQRERRMVTRRQRVNSRYFAAACP